MTISLVQQKNKRKEELTHGALHQGMIRWLDTLSALTVEGKQLEVLNDKQGSTVLERLTSRKQSLIKVSRTSNYHTIRNSDAEMGIFIECRDRVE